ncbi:hypothetical protein ACEN2J_01460 [Pseudorhodobacter sp. W20_MBD10_FR17]|uniref:hypothetical protein n=1 Tax=Pseudorhodobacter sp. W20_MBD10_FR17 TaxID=3240266 RepID=UPI003F99B183
MMIHGPNASSANIEHNSTFMRALVLAPTPIFEDTARLALLTWGLNPRGLTGTQVQSLITKFDVEWDV